MPVAVLAVPFLAGSTAGVISAGAAPDALLRSAAAACVVATVAAVGFLLDDDAHGVTCAVILGGLLGGFAGGAASARDLYAPPLLAWFLEGTSEEPEPVAIEGILREDAAATAGGVLLTLNVTRRIDDAVPATVGGGVRVSVGGSPPAAQIAEWRAGRTLRVTALLRLPGTFHNPGGQDDRLALARRGVVLTGSVKSAALVEGLERAGLIAESAGAVRTWVRQTLSRHIARRSGRSGAIATAILIGDRTGLSDEDERRLQDAGTYHVIAISGGNIATLTVLLLGVARLIGAPYRLAAAASILILVFYGEVAGGAPSVARAITAAVLFLCAIVLDHRGGPLNVLSVAALSAVAVMPVILFDAGFLMSFGATAGIILGVPLFTRFSSDGGRPRAGAGRLVVFVVQGILVATVCAEIVLAPIAASFFGRATIAGVVLNLAAIPLMTVVQCGSLVLLAAAPVNASIADATGVVVHYAAAGLVESSRLVDAMPWVARDVRPPALWLCASYYLGLTGLAGGRRHRRWGLPLLVTAAATMLAGPDVATHSAAPPSRHGALRVVVLDVGQGDATVVIPPAGDAVLVDAAGLAGTTFDIASRVLLPSLRALGVGRLHGLVLTHGDPDHIGGADVLLRRLKTSAVWEGVPVPPHPTLRRLTDVATDRRIPWRIVRPGDVDRIGGAEIRVLHPPEPDWERQRVRNDDSVVLEVRYGNVSILLPGDIGREVEGALAPTLHLGPIVVLKAAHHGSATSSSEAFLDAVSPHAVIFSAGRNNRFGHPARAVVERFARRGVKMFSTAEDGAVFLDTDGNEVGVWGWKTRKTFVARPNHGGATTRRHR